MTAEAERPNLPQLCRYGEPTPGFTTQPCDCAAGACRLGRDSQPAQPHLTARSEGGDEWLKEHERLAAKYGTTCAEQSDDASDDMQACRDAWDALIAHARPRPAAGGEAVAYRRVVYRTSGAPYWSYTETRISDADEPLYTHPTAQAGDATNAADGGMAVQPSPPEWCEAMRYLSEAQVQAIHNETRRIAGEALPRGGQPE